MLSKRLFSELSNTLCINGGAVEKKERNKEVSWVFYGVNKSYVSEVIWNWLIYVLIVLYRSESGWEKDGLNVSLVDYSWRRVGIT